jgi:hypothetical protein
LASGRVRDYSAVDTGAPFAETRVGLGRVTIE